MEKMPAKPLGIGKTGGSTLVLAPSKSGSMALRRALAVAGIAYQLAASVAASTDGALAAEVIGCGTVLVGKVPVALQNGIPMVKLMANGQPFTLVLDTGAERTVLTPSAADRIKAQTPEIEFQRQVHGIAGTLPTREIEFRSLAAGNVAIPWRRALVAAIAVPTISTGVDGLLGAETLSDFDIDLDLPHLQLGLYQKQSCSTAAPDWPQPYSQISTGRSRSERLFFPIRLDNHQIVAFIDTGSQKSVLSLAAARAMGMVEKTLARDRQTTLRSVTAERLDGYVHRFSKLAIGAAVVHEPEIIVADAKFAEADMLLGTDVVSTQRLWLSYGSRRIFSAGR
jgi:predicted aspartyl protease